MEANAYLDFDLRFTRDAEGYRAQVVQSPGGIGEHAFRLPFEEHELENYLLKIGQRRAGMRSADAPESQTAREFGKKLYDALFQDEVATAFLSSMEAARAADRGLRIRLRLGETPELADLPWEYLYQAKRREFLALSRETPVVRYFDLPDKVKPLAVTPPLRVLVMLSNPSDVDCLDVEKEWGKLKEAVRDLEERKLLVIDRLPRATLTELLNRLRKTDYHVFHFVGHGSFNPTTQESVLALENEKGSKSLISGDDLGIYLRDEKALRLVLLNACEGARASRTDPFSGAAQSLVLKGVPAVIAMQFEVSDEAAIAMAGGFYAALADDYPVDAALTEARKAVFAAGCSVEWGTPVLYLRAEDGRIFDVTKTPAQKADEAVRPQPILPPPLPPEPVRKENVFVRPVPDPVPAPVPVKPLSTKTPRRWVWLLVGIVMTFGVFLALGLWVNLHKQTTKPVPAFSPTPSPTSSANPTPTSSETPWHDDLDETGPMFAAGGLFYELAQAITALKSQQGSAAPAGWTFRPVGQWKAYASPPAIWSQINFQPNGQFSGTGYDESGNELPVSGWWRYDANGSLLRLDYSDQQRSWIQWVMMRQGKLFLSSFQQNGILIEGYLLKDE